MTIHSPIPTSSLLLPRLAFSAPPPRLPRLAHQGLARRGLARQEPDRQGLSRRELRGLVAEMLG